MPQDPGGSLAPSAGAVGQRAWVSSLSQFLRGCISFASLVRGSISSPLASDAHPLQSPAGLLDCGSWTPSLEPFHCQHNLGLTAWISPRRALPVVGASVSMVTARPYIFVNNWGKKGVQISPYKLSMHKLFLALNAMLNEYIFLRCKHSGKPL